MDPEVQKALLQLVQEAKGMAAKEIPLVLHDLLVAGVIDSIIGIFFGVLGFVGVYALIRVYRYWQRYDEQAGMFNDRYDMQRFFGGIGIAAGAIMSCAILSISFYNLFTIWLAPRAYLIELVKGQ